MFNKSRINSLVSELERARDEISIMGDNLREMDRVITESKNQHAGLEVELANRDTIITELNDKIEQMQLSIDEYQKSDHLSHNNHIYFMISDDLQTVSPIIRYKEGVEEKLIEQHILNDGNVTPYGIQIGLALVVKDALDLMVESATEAMDDAEG